MSKTIHKIFHVIDVIIWVIVSVVVFAILYMILKRFRKWSEASRFKKCFAETGREEAELKMQLGIAPDAGGSSQPAGASASPAGGQA